MIEYLRALVASATILWQLAGTAFPSEPRMEIQLGDSAFPTAQASIGICEVNERNSSCPFDCIFVFGGSFWDLDETGRHITIIHEVGHCLGLDHHHGGIMAGSMYLTTEGLPSDYDLAQKRAIWPYANRVTIGGIAHD